MPDLSHQASSQFWFEYVDPIIYQVITFMESVEDWTIDGNLELEEAIKALGTELDNLSYIDINKLAQAENFIQLIAYIKTGRGLRILQAIDSARPGSASRVLVYAEENSLGGTDPSTFFLKRNIIFERLRLLSRTFSDSRRKLIIRALEGEEQ